MLLLACAPSVELHVASHGIVGEPIPATGQITPGANAFWYLDGERVCRDERAVQGITSCRVDADEGLHRITLVAGGPWGNAEESAIVVAIQAVEPSCVIESPLWLVPGPEVELRTDDQLGVTWSIEHEIVATSPEATIELPDGDYLLGLEVETLGGACDTVRQISVGCDPVLGLELPAEVDAGVPFEVVATLPACADIAEGRIRFESDLDGYLDWGDRNDPTELSLTPGTHTLTAWTNCAELDLSATAVVEAW